MSIEIRKPILTGNLEVDKALLLLYEQDRKINLEIERIDSATTTDLTSIESDISTLQSDVSTLQSDMTTAQSDITTLQTGKLAIADIDDTPANDADVPVSSKWVYDNFKSYDSGWVSLGDWTDATETVTHNLGKNLADLVVRLFWSASGATGSDNYDITSIVAENTSAEAFGSVVKEIDTNSITFQTGSSGAIYLNSSGAFAGITSGYYRVKIYYLGF